MWNTPAPVNLLSQTQRRRSGWERLSGAGEAAVRGPGTARSSWSYCVSTCANLPQRTGAIVIALQWHIDPHRKRIRRIVLIKQCVTREVVIVLIKQCVTHEVVIVLIKQCVTREVVRLLANKRPGPPHSFSVGSASQTLAMHSTFGRFLAIALSVFKSAATPQKQSLPALTPATVSLAAWSQKHTLRTALPVTVVVAVNRMVDADLALAWCRRWAGWWRHGRHEIVKHHRERGPTQTSPKRAQHIRSRIQTPVLLHEAGHSGAPVMWAL